MRLRLLLLPIVFAACGNPTTPIREPDEFPSCGTDESWRTFDDRETTGQVITDDTQAPPITMPSASAPLAQPTRFTWQVSPTIAGMAGGDVMCSQCPMGTTCGALTTDHLPPVSGDVYDLQILDGTAVIWRVITTLQYWDPPMAAWSTFHGKSLKLKLVRMSVLVNDVKDGPYQASSPFAFSVQ